jgi:IS1 family transposase
MLSAMNKLKLAAQVKVINALVEGCSIRSVERMTGVHRDTIMRLLVQVGDGCAKLMDDEMRNLSCRRIQVDEIWSYCQKKQAHITRADDRSRVGDQWTFVAIDADTKLIPAYRVGKRTRVNTIAFIADLSGRLANRVQLSSDAFGAYLEAVEQSFGGKVDYGQSVKFYEADPIGPGRYSPPKVVRAERTVIVGNPEHEHISTSFIERQNLTMRMSMKRFARLTLGFSKKLENMTAAVSLHFAHYNFSRLHRSLRMTPAMAAGVTSRLWSLEELVERAAN